MSETAKETNCTRCVHRQVCKHKEDFLNVVNAINNALALIFCIKRRNFNYDNKRIPEKSNENC